MLYLHGGHPQQETFDPKPEGPVDLKGEFGAIPTSVPGVQFSELLPRCASLMHKMAVIRAMTHENSNHVHASLPANTGHHHPDNAPVETFRLRTKISHRLERFWISWGLPMPSCRTGFASVP